MPYGLDNKRHSYHPRLGDGYTAYGLVTTFDAGYNAHMSSSRVGNPFTFTGRELDAETGLMHYRARTYDPAEGRFKQRDPLGYVNGMNLFEYVRSQPTTAADPSGREAEPEAETVVKCSGVCGAIVDDWFVDEIKAQIMGYEAWKKEDPAVRKIRTIDDYLMWANGNQRYKDPAYFAFNKGTNCGTKTGQVGCGAAVTLCGFCVRSAILGNIMYGFMAGYGNYQDYDKGAVKTKKTWGLTVDKYDSDTYKAGYDLWTELAGAAKVFPVGGPEGVVRVLVDPKAICPALKKLVAATPSALYEGRKEGGYNDLSSCAPCNQKTTETRHGGKEKPAKLP